MKTVALVPIKGPIQAKSRLAGALNTEERADLARNMTANVLIAATASHELSDVAVISPIVAALDLPPGIIRITQKGYGLNSGLEQGREWALSVGADALLILFADLPLLKSSDVSAMVKLGRLPGTLVLAPDRHGDGTNAMLTHPVTIARFAFGPGSFKRHRAAGREAGAHTKLYFSPGTELDVDTPDDLEYLSLENSIVADRLLNRLAETVLLY